MKHRILLCVLAAMFLVGSAVPALAQRRDREEAEIVDARLEGYANTSAGPTQVALKPQSTALMYLLLLFLAVVGLAVMFKNARRTHLD